MARQFTLYSAFLAAGLSFLLFVSYQGTGESQSNAGTDATEENRIPQVITSIDLNKDYSFAGERVPTDNFDAMERLDRELSINTYWHSQTLLNIKQAHRFFPVIEPILKAHGVPDDFKYLAVAESGLRNATSYAGAKGYWQFLKSTAESQGLEISNDVDERYHITKSTEAACRYLNAFFEKFSSWTLAAAAYNMGGSRLSRLLDEQHAEDYYELNINEETSRYVFRIIAIKEILSSPDNFGFYIKEEQKYQPLDRYRIVKVSGSIDNLGAFAKEHGTDYRTLKLYNPWLITSNLSNPRNKTYEIKIPK